MFKIDLLNFGDGRYEKKFVIQELDSKEIEQIIRNHPAIFSEIFYPRVVNNIYLDSLNMKNYFDHTAGSSQRLKVRIRWYGATFGLIKKPVLEIKIKSHELGKKVLFKLKSLKLDEKFSASLLHKDIFPNSNLPNFLVEELQSLYPALLNCYTRSYFISADKLYRITLDTDLRFFEIGSSNNIFFEEKIINQIKILELKYPRSEENFSDRITQHLPFRLSANSKYMKGIDMLG